MKYTFIIKSIKILTLNLIWKIDDVVLFYITVQNGKFYYKNLK